MIELQAFTRKIMTVAYDKISNGESVGFVASPGEDSYYDSMDTRHLQEILQKLMNSRPVVALVATAAIGTDTEFKRGKRRINCLIVSFYKDRKWTRSLGFPIINEHNSVAFGKPQQFHHEPYFGPEDIHSYSL